MKDALAALDAATQYEQSEDHAGKPVRAEPGGSQPLFAVQIVAEKRGLSFPSGSTAALAFDLSPTLRNHAVCFFALQPVPVVERTSTETSRLDQSSRYATSSTIPVLPPEEATTSKRSR